MKRIKSPEDAKREKGRNKLIVGFILIFLMVFSTAGFALFGRSSSSNNGSNFDQSEAADAYYDGYRWIYSFGGQQFYFANNLDSVKEIPVDISFTLQNYASSSVFIVAESDEVLNEISNNLDRYTARLQEACYGPCEEDLPEKDCTENLIVWINSDVGRVYQEENCVFIEGDLATVDAFLYKILGIS